jgi:sphingomyelin phosphodiesterase acid-like 3
MRLFTLYCLICFTCLFSQASMPANTPFISLTDIHFNPFAACNIDTTPCPIVEKLRTASATEWNMILAEGDKTAPAFKQDTNYLLFQSALTHLKQNAADQKVRFVIILGDVLAHAFQENFEHYSSDKSSEAYQLFVNKTYAFITGELNRTFPTIDVYPVIGNNDSYAGDDAVDPHGAFYHDVSQVWTSTLIRNKAAKTAIDNEFSANGYYATDLPTRPSLRLIVLNASLFSQKARGENIDPAAYAELDWLHNEFAAAARNNQKILIAMHTPAGIDVYNTIRKSASQPIELWKPAFTERYISELQAYASSIVAILPAHLHMDWQQVLTFNNNHHIIVSGTPALSPMFENNPSYKIFNYNTSRAVLSNFTTYYYPLDGDQTWRKEYNFNEVYQPNCTACNILDGMQRLQPTNELAEKYKLFFYTSKPNTTFIEKWLPFYWCQTQTITASTYAACLVMNGSRINATRFPG